MIEPIIRLLQSNELELTLPLIQLLNPGLEEQVLLDRMRQMPDYGYHCVGVFQGDKLVGCCGFWILMKYYAGKHLEPDNVMIHPDYRNLGLGEKMIAFVEQFAREQDCEALELNVYVSNLAGQRFWTRQGFNTIGHHMQKKL
jgi:ribosomal protein S18 acetylase RimI-like enzyme